jgi:hypothetical protein
MRLNFNNIGVGLEAIAGAKRASDLARESARYDVTEGAYGPGLQANIQQLQSLRDQDPAQAPAYDQAIEELTRRQGLTAPDYSVASGPTNFATRQEARQASAPLRAEGLAGVYRRYGDVEKADALEARAYEQQRALAAERRAEAGERRAEAGEGRAAQAFSTQQTLVGLDINQRSRAEAELQRETDFAKFAAERPDATTQELKDAAFKQFNFTPKQWQAAVNTRLGIKENEQKDFVLNIKGKLKGKNLTQLGELYNSDPDFDDKTDLAIVPGKGGAVTLNFIDKATGKVTSSQPFKNEALATEFLNKQATEPETIGTWMMALKKTETGIAADEARIRASDAQTREAGKSAVEKNLATLQRLGIAVSPEDVRAMAGIKQEKLSPEAAARLEVITASVKGNESPKALAQAQAEITDLFKGEALKQRNTTIVNGLKKASTKNDLPAAIKQLRDAGVGDETIVGLARQAGVALPANFAPAAAPATAPVTAPAAAPAVSPRTGLSSGQQQYGPLTPMATIEADARAGIPAAVAYLKQMADRDRARTENAIRAAQGE